MHAQERRNKMNEVQLFNFENHEVRSLLINSEPWFVGKDVAEILSYSNTRKALTDHVDAEDKMDGVTIRDSIGRNQKPVLINESGLYSLVLSSKLPSAKKFKRWVTSEVLPALRKTGSYSIQPTLPKTYKEALIELVAQVEANEKLELENKMKDQQLNELKPKADYYDQILQSKSLVLISQIAKDYGYGAPTMNKKLHELGVQYKQGGQWLLYSKYQNKGYTHSRTINITRSDGRSDVRMQTEWTQKGRLFLYELLRKNGILPIIEQN